MKSGLKFNVNTGTTQLKFTIELFVNEQINFKNVQLAVYFTN
jgi:hypothetical protein